MHDMGTTYFLIFFIRPEIKKAIQLMTLKFDMNIIYRNALYGEPGGDDKTNQTLLRFIGITVPGFLVMVGLTVFICCCTR